MRTRNSDSTTAVRLREDARGLHKMVPSQHASVRVNVSALTTHAKSLSKNIFPAWRLVRRNFEAAQTRQPSETAPWRSNVGKHCRADAQLSSSVSCEFVSSLPFLLMMLSSRGELGEITTAHEIPQP